MEDIYGKALADMGSEPLEYGEPRGPGRRRGGRNPNAGRKSIGTAPRVGRQIRLDPAIVEGIAKYATDNDISFSEAVNRLVAAGLATN